MTDQEQEHKSIPVAVARAAVQSSGLLEALDGPHYLSSQSPEWRPYFAPSEDIAHPDFARVIITRQGQKPREVVISWDEYEAEIETEQEQAWAEGRRLKPMTIFGAEAERHAYRVAFADVLAAATPPRIVSATDFDPSKVKSDRMMVISDDRPAAGWDLPARDWIAEVQAVSDLVGLNKLDDEARAAGALAKVDGLQQAIMNRMLDLTAAPKPKPAPRPAVTDRLASKGKPKPRRRRPRPDEAA